MKKVYLIRLEGGGDTEEKFVTEEAWNWVMSEDRGLPPLPAAGYWEDQLVPDSVMETMKDYYGDPDMEVMLTSGSWQNDRALACPPDPGVDLSMLDLGALRDSFAAQGFEYTGEVYEGCIY